MMLMMIIYMDLQPTVTYSYYQLQLLQQRQQWHKLTSKEVGTLDAHRMCICKLKKKNQFENLLVV